MWGMGWCSMRAVFGGLLFFPSDCHSLRSVLLCCCPSALLCVLQQWPWKVLHLCHSNLSNVPSLRCLHTEITSLPMEDWCLNVPLKVRRNNTGIIHHGWDHFLLQSKVSGGHIYYLMGVFWSFKSFFLMSCQKRNSYFSSNFTKPLW